MRVSEECIQVDVPGCTCNTCMLLKQRLFFCEAPVKLPVLKTAESRGTRSPLGFPFLMAVFSGFSSSPAHEDPGLFLFCGSNPGWSRGLKAATPAPESGLFAGGGSLGRLGFRLHRLQHGKGLLSPG